MSDRVCSTYIIIVIKVEYHNTFLSSSSLIIVTNITSHSEKSNWLRMLSNFKRMRSPKTGKRCQKKESNLKEKFKYDEDLKRITPMLGIKSWRQRYVQQQKPSMTYNQYLDKSLTVIFGHLIFQTSLSQSQHNHDSGTFLMDQP